MRLWPIAFTALIAGALGVFFPGVAAVGAGYALLVSLAWHTREAAVLGIEQRDGVKFYVVPTFGCADRAGAAHRGCAAAAQRLASRLNSRQPRVLATCAGVSQARRAVATA